MSQDVVPRLYLDVCCLNRPFDDAGVDRNRLEAEAVLTILRRASRGQVTIIGSAVLAVEIGQNPDPDRRERVKALLDLVTESVRLGETVRQRAGELNLIGIRPFDALHLACAEVGGCDAMLTTDDRLLRKAAAAGGAVGIRVMNPLRWLSEAIQDEHG